MRGSISIPLGITGSKLLVLRKFAKNQLNILMLTVVYKGVAIPLLFSMLPKSGNSSTKERIELLEKYNQTFSGSTIDCLIADREFVGEEW